MLAFSFGSLLYLSFGALLLLIVILFILLRIKSQLIFDVYPSKGIFYGLKYTISWLILRYAREHFYHSIMQHHFVKISSREEKSEEKANNNITSEVGDNFDYLAHLERPQFLSKHPEWYDVVSIMATSKLGEKLLVTMERRHRGIIKACLYIWLPGYGLLSSTNLPDMLYFTTDGNTESVAFKAGGLYLRPIKPMCQWYLNYEGILVSNKDQTPYQINLNMEFKSNGSFFYYNRDLSSEVIADSIARESWNQRFYAMLKNIGKILEKRMHYEQSGALKGFIKITAIADDARDSNDSLNSNKVGTTLEVKELQMQAVRDHSFGTERCLSSINRYVYIALFLEDGTNILVGNLSQPNFFLSSLKVGFVNTPDGIYSPITSCNFELYSYGERGTPSNYQNFIIETVADRKYFIQINAEKTVERFMGSNWEAKIYNQFVSCCVNGKPGHGITEYLYRYQGGRPAQYRKNDPKWFQKLLDEKTKDCNNEFATSF